LTAYRDRHWKTFDSARDFGKKLRGIAANSVHNELRKNARRQRILQSEAVELFIVSQLSPKIFGDDILDGVGFPELN
jgi:DNA-directed RNA polymerase specialized sigma24 family protein